MNKDLHHHPHKIQLVAIDLDGTLLTSRKSITPLTRIAIRDALNAGIKIVLATARPPRSVRGYYTALKLDTPTINYNGALIWNETEKRVIQHNPLDVNIAKKVIAWARKKFPDLLVSVEILDKWYTDHYADIPEYMTETSKHFAPDFVGPLEAFMRVPITKLLLLGNPKWIQDLEKSALPKFKKIVAQTRSDPHLLQFMNPAVSKATALANVAASFNIQPQNIMAIGDAPNDIHMLQYAGLAVTPENAWKEVKLIAHATLPSNDHDCVAIALQKFVL